MTESVSETWVNVYRFGTTGLVNDSPKDADFWASNGSEYCSNYVRVEHRYNGHWHRPPVGMRGRDASHGRHCGPAGESTMLVKR